MLRVESGVGLVGRQPELAVLAAALDRLAPGTHPARPVVHIVGEPGIGKSGLLDALRGLGAARGVPVLTGRATEFEAHAPFGAITDALDEPFADAVHAGTLALEPAEAALLSRVFPAIDTDDWSTSDMERPRLYRTVRAALERLADARGLVLAVDDLHWADHSTLELLRYLTRRPPAAPLLIVLAFRPRQLGADIVRELSGPVVDDVIRLELAPLRPGDADRLLGPAVPASRRRDLYARSGGNPLYLTELARDDDEQRGADDPFQRELATLPEPQLRALRAAAIVGDVVDAGLVAAVAELSATAALAALTALTGRDLLRPHVDGTRWRHRHPLLRHVVYTRTPPGWRLAAHARAVAELAARGESAVVIAEHLCRCAAPGDRWAVDRLVEAAGPAMRIAPASAAHWLDVALRLLPDGADGPCRVNLLTERVTALHRSGQLTQARRAVQDALAVLTPAMTAHRTQLVGLAASVERLLGRHDEARALLRAELDRNPAAATRSGLVMELVVTSVLAGDFRTAQELAGGIDGGRDVGSVVRAAKLALTALAESAGHTATAEHLARLAAADALVDGLSEAELGTVIEIPVWLGLADIQADRLTEAHRHLTRGLAIAERTGQHQVFTYLKLLLSSCAFGFGALADAAAAAEDALAAALLGGNDQFMLMALLRLGNVTAWQGDLAAAEDILARAGRLAASTARVFESQVRLSRSVCLFLAGQVDECVAAILDATNGGDFSTVLTASRVDWLELLTEAEIARGHPDRAMDWAKHADEASAALCGGRQRGLALLARAWAKLPGSPSEAVLAAEPAIAVLTDAGDDLSLARALAFAGRALAESGDPVAAAIRYARARTTAERAGALALVGQIDAASRRLAAAAVRTEDLTERERAIAELILAGRTNREIAGRLFLSLRSIEASVSRIYAKTGVRGRTRLIAHLTAARPPD